MSKTIMVAVDGSEESDYALKEAIALATLFPKVHLDLIHVTPIQPSSWFDPFHDRIELITNFEAREETKLLQDGWMKSVKSFVDAAPDKRSGEVMIYEGDPRYILAEKASENNVDYLVIGTRGLGGLKGAILGSVAKYLVQAASVPVLVTKLPKKK